MSDLNQSLDKLDDAISGVLEENARLRARVAFLNRVVNEKLTQSCGFFCALPECPKSMERFDAQQEPVRQG